MTPLTFHDRFSQACHMTKKRKRSVQTVPIAELHKLQAESLSILNKTPVELQVRDSNHALSPEVVDFSIQHLVSGGTWGELRRKLGLGPAYADRRWRALRHMILEQALPKDEDEALKAKYATNQYLLGKLEKYVEEIEDRIKARINDDNEHHFLKIKLDSLKMMFERNEIDFEHYLEMKKLKNVDKRSQGISIVFQNITKINRPGDSIDVTPKQIEGDDE